MTNDLKSATDRLRRIKGGESFAAVYGRDEPCDQHHADQYAVINAWLAFAESKADKPHEADDQPSDAQLELIATATEPQDTTATVNIPLHCREEICAVCGAQAVVKWEEPGSGTLTVGAWTRRVHPRTWYLCGEHHAQAREQGALPAQPTPATLSDEDLAAAPSPPPASWYAEEWQRPSPATVDLPDGPGAWLHNESQPNEVYVIWDTELGIETPLYSFWMFSNETGRQGHCGIIDSLPRGGWSRLTPANAEIEHLSVTELAAKHPNLHEYVSQIEAELTTLRQQLEAAEDRSRVLREALNKIEGGHFDTPEDDLEAALVAHQVCARAALATKGPTDA